MTMAAPTANIRQCQRRDIESMLTMSQEGQPKGASSVRDKWKVLVIDRVGQDILAPLIKVADLRRFGVTLHLLLHADRTSIPDVPAVYFCLPTQENVDRIAKDVKNQTYETVSLNFVTPIPRHLLEQLADTAVKANVPNMITKVVDQYTNFVVLEDNLFTMSAGTKDSVSYLALNNPRAKDVEMEGAVATIVESLFSMLVSRGTVPIIRCPKGGAAEMVASQLDRRLRQQIGGRTGLFKEGAMDLLQRQRPVLVLLDRNIDLTAMLHHTWTYQALIHDVHGIKSNSVSFDSVAAEGQTSKLTRLDLDEADKFWVCNQGKPFPAVTTAIQEEAESYAQVETHITKIDAGGQDGETDLVANTQKLASAISSLPELRERKRLLDAHTTVAMSLLHNIKSRKLDELFAHEENMLAQSTLDRPFEDILRDETVGTPEDKLRLLIIRFLTSDLSEDKLREFSLELQENGTDLNCLLFLKQVKTYNKMLATTPQEASTVGESLTSSSSSVFRKFNKALAQGTEMLQQGVKNMNLMLSKKNGPVTHILTSIINAKQNEVTETFHYYDPKARQDMGGNVPRRDTTFNDAIVFVVGGGSYLEYQELVDAVSSAKMDEERSVVYGCTELPTPRQFLQHLNELGKLY